MNILTGIDQQLRAMLTQGAMTSEVTHPSSHSFSTDNLYIIVLLNQWFESTCLQMSGILVSILLYSNVPVPFKIS